ncbi:HAD-IIA family hydrolase [Chloroflexota bacterium]
MKAVILAAGGGSRLNTITCNKPKCMVRVGGRPILEHQIHAYVSAGVKDIFVVAGYRLDEVKEFCRGIKNANIKIIENKTHATTNNMYSLYLAKEAVAEKAFLLSNGDVVPDPDIIYELAHSELSDAIACNEGSYAKESMKITINTHGYVNDISKEIPSSKAYGNSIDVYKFSPVSSKLFFTEISKIIEQENNVKDWVEVALQRLLIDGQAKMKPFDIGTKCWVEVDDMGDLLLADKLFSKIGPLESKKLFLIDLDGTTYLGDEAINGAKEFIAKLRAKNKYVYFLSNNSSKSKADYVKKLNSMGIEAFENEIVLSTDGVIQFLLQEGVSDIFVVGTNSMKQAFERAGFNTESNNPSYVVLGYDTELTYSKIRRAALLLQKGVDLIATHCDVVCPTPEGAIPDIGSMLALLETATGKAPLKIFGKPNPEMVSHVMAHHHVTAEGTVLIGDRLYTDMELARRIGCSFVCVLSGETHRENIAEIEHQPSLIVKNMGELIDFLE